MAFSPPQCAVNMEQRLAALRRDQEIDGLRVYLIKYNLFPRNRDPDNSPIRVEELKELVKYWKLHRQRGFWRDHPEKDDLVRALLQHIRSEAANKKRRQEAQEKYNRSYKGNQAALSGDGHGHGSAVVGSGEMSDAAKRDFSMILSGGKEYLGGDEGDEGNAGVGGNGGGCGGSAKSFLKNRMGGDLFYQRGDYDEGMIYLSRIDKSRFASDDQDPRSELRTTTASVATPLGHLVQMGSANKARAAAAAVADRRMPEGITTWSHHSLQHQQLQHPVGASTGGPNPAALTRETKLKSVEGLYNVSRHRGFEAQVVREGALATIAATLKTDDAAVRVLAAATLLNLTAVSAVAPKMSQNSHQQAPARLANGTPLSLAPATAKELYGKMIDEGVLVSLLDLSHTAHPLVKTFCARTLFRFTIDDTHHFRMVHEGVVVALTQLMTAIPGDDDHRQACVHALVNLAAIPRAVTCDAILTTLVALAKSATAILSAPPAVAAEEGGPRASEDKETPAQKATAILSGCAQALLNLSILPTTRSSMVEEGAMVALSIVSSTKQLPLCETVSSVLSNCASIRFNQELMLKNNVSTLLFDLLELVAVSLERLKQEEGEAAAEADANIDALQAFTTARDLLTRIRRNCANVVAHFCCNAKLQPRVTSAGFVPKLLTILRLGGALGQLDEETEKFCIISLANLALDDRCRQILVHEGAVPLLLRTLKEPSAIPLPEGDAEAAAHVSVRTLLKLDCVTALSNLMLHPKNFTRMVDEGVVPALLAMVQLSDNAEIQRACVYAMLNMAKDPAMKTRLAQATASDAEPGAIPTMLAYASKQLNNAELCGVCVSFFQHLSTRAENYEVLYFEGTVGLAVRVLQKRCTAEPVHVIYDLWLCCMLTLSNLANHPDKRATFLDDGVLEAIQHVLAASSADSRRRDKRVETKLVTLQLAASQIVFKLQDLCCGPKKTDVPAFFSSLLLLATQSAAKNSHLERKAVHCRQRTVLRCALTIARCATRSQRGLRLLATQSEFPPALNGIMRTGLLEAQVCAAIALCNLATERGKLKPRVWRDATTDDFIVVTLLRLNSDQTKEICAKALFNLLTHDDTRDRMIKDGVLYALIKLSARLDSEEIRDLALRSIYNTSLVGSDQQQLLLDMEIVRVLTKMYQAEFSKEMKRLLCGILSNLSAVSGHEAQILNEGALSVLKHLAKVRDPETKVYAANILYNLSCCADVSDALVRGSGSGNGDESGATASTASGGGGATGGVTNVLSLLIALLKSESRDARRYAALTVANLSGNGLAVQLMTEGHNVANGNGGAMVGVLNDVLKRTMASCLVTSAACVFALRNLLTVAVNLQRFIDSNGVVTLAAILSCVEMESEAHALHVATDLLCGLANFERGTEGFEDRLVKDGTIKALHAIAKGSVSVSASTTAAMNIMTALSNLSRNRNCHELMLRDGVLETVALLARTNLHSPSGAHGDDLRAAYRGLVTVKGEDFCHHCVVVLRNLAHQPELASPWGPDSTSLDVRGQRLSSQPAVVHIALALAQSTHAETREHVVVTLHNLALHRRCRMQLLKHDGVKVILRLGTNATSAVNRHICGLTLQLLSKPNDAGDNPHIANIQQEGIVAAIAALAEPHHHDLLLLAVNGCHAVVDPKPSDSAVAKPGGRVDEAALLAASHAPVPQQGAPPDWIKVSIPNMSPWPHLEALAHAINEGNDDDDENVDDDVDVDADVDDSDEDLEAGAATTPMNAKTTTTSTLAPLSPVNSRLRTPSHVPPQAQPASSTVPRVCSVDVVLGSLALLEDDKLDKVHVDVDVELAALALRRTSSAAGGVRGGGPGDELPALNSTRPASAPEAEEVTATANDAGAAVSASKNKTQKRSTLSVARHDAVAVAAGGGTSPQPSPLKSPSMAPMSSPKRKSRTLEPLAVSGSTAALR